MPSATLAFSTTSSSASTAANDGAAAADEQAAGHDEAAHDEAAGHDAAANEATADGANAVCVLVSPPRMLLLSLVMLALVLLTLNTCILLCSGDRSGRSEALAGCTCTSAMQSTTTSSRKSFERSA